MENRGIDRGEIASAKVQCGNRSPLRFSFSLCLTYNVSLSPFSAPLSVVLPRISFLVLFPFFIIFKLLRRSSSVSLDLLDVFFLVLSTLSSFSAKFSLHALLYFLFAKSTKSFVLLLLDDQVQLTSRLLVRMLYAKKNLSLSNFLCLFLRVMKLGENYNTMKC